MTSKILENILDTKFENSCVIFLFAGLGIGKIYNELSGCTLQTHEFELLAKNNPNINFYGISSQKTPSNNNIIYKTISQKQCKNFKCIVKDNIIYLKRITYIIHNNKITTFENKNSTSHINYINNFLENQA